jgi:hypothetical protein
MRSCEGLSRFGHATLLLNLASQSRCDSGICYIAMYCSAFVSPALFPRHRLLLVSYPLSLNVYPICFVSKQRYHHLTHAMRSRPSF